MSQELVIFSDEWETRCALVEDKQIVELFFARRPAYLKVGSIYLGKVKDILPGIGAAFVDIGHEKNAFLFLEDEPMWLHQEKIKISPESLRKGQPVMVQLAKLPLLNKGARVTTRIGLPGRFSVFLPDTAKKGVSKKIPEKYREQLRKIAEEIDLGSGGMIIRTTAQNVDKKIIKKELQYLKRKWDEIGKKASSVPAPAVLHEEFDLGFRLVRDLFTHEMDKCTVNKPGLYKKISGYLKQNDPTLINRLELDEENVLSDKYDIDKAINEAIKRTVNLRSGGYIAIDHTEALTAIDVNTGKFTGKKRLEETILKTNLEAASEIVRQLRLRDIGGIIVIDFIGMKEEQSKEKLFKKFTKALEKDRSKSNVVELSPLGLIEMTRKSVYESPIDFFYEPCTYCAGTGKVVSAETSAINVRRKIRELCKRRPYNSFLVKIHPLVAAELKAVQGDRIKETHTGKDVFVVLDAHIKIDNIEMVREGDTKEIIRWMQFYPSGTSKLI